MPPKRLDITKAQLKHLYWGKDLTTYEIAPILNLHPATVAKKLREFNIPKKPPKQIVKISQKELTRLYYGSKLSTYKIASLLDCSVRTVRNKMKKYAIKARPIKKVEVARETLLTLYREKGLSLREIGKIYNLTPSGVLRKTRKFNISLRNSWETNTRPKKPFRGSNEEKAYLIGFRLGDLGVRLSSKQTKRILTGCNTTKKEQVELIKNLFQNYADIWISKSKSNGVISISALLHPSFSFLLPKKDLIEKWIITDQKCMTAFVAGYIDAEGSFGVYNNRAKFRLGSYDKVILKHIAAWLTKQGIKTLLHLERKKHLGQNKNFWRLTVNEAGSLLKLSDIIQPQLRHGKRKADLIKVNKNIISRLKNGTIRI